ncbi:MAG: alpha-amylase family glycosyl hydrolase [Candidatus Krumholzibacteriota bacterium]
MNYSLKWAHLLVAIAAVLFTATIAQAIPITFQVRMARQIELGNFDPATDFVDLAGTFNGWGTDPLTVLSDADGDTIYEITLDGFSSSDFIEFKFRLNGLWDGSEEFPGGPNRVYVVEPADNLILVWYNDDVPNGGVGPLHWWNDAVFYEIFVRSFQDSDGDGIGDFQGLTQKLDYLNDGDPATTDDLGVTGIWLMPINDSPSYHGYDSVDYRSINPDYGTMADFEAFLAAAHARGIKVIIDYVMNHCSTDHPWFVASGQNDPAYRDYFRWSPSDPGQTGPWGQNLWHWHSSGYYYGLFWSGMPDLNYKTTAVKDEMFDTATYWLDAIGVDGFRLDAVLYIGEDGDQVQNTAFTLQFWQDYNAHVKAVKPDVLSVGEAWTGSTIVRLYVVEDRLDFCFEFDLSYATLGAVNSGVAGYLGGKADQVYGLYPHLQFGTFLTNHDQDRSFDVLGNDEDKAKVAAGIYLTLPGIPFVYYGEEIGMVGTGAHENIRSPMQWTDGPEAGFTTGTPWQSVNANFQQFNVLVEEPDPGSLLNWYKQLIHLRNQTPSLRRGIHEPLTSSVSAVMSFVRSFEQETVLCLANTSPGSENGITLTGSAASLVPGVHTITNLLDPTDTFDITVSPSYEISGLDLAGYEVAVYRFAGVSNVETGGGLPESALRLGQNYPNPFNPSTTIHYFVPARSHVRLGVYDVAGREVAVILDEVQAPGPQEVRWQGMDSRGQAVGAGVYFLRLEAGGETMLSKITLVK